MLPIDYMRCNLYNKHVNKRYGAAKRQKGNEMKLFMTKKEKLAKKEELNAKRDALAKEYAETVKRVWRLKQRRVKSFLGATSSAPNKFLLKCPKLNCKS